MTSRTRARYIISRIFIGLGLGFLISSIYLVKLAAKAERDEELVSNQLEKAIKIIKSKTELARSKKPDRLASIKLGGDDLKNKLKSSLLSLEESLDIESLVSKCIEQPEYSEFLLGVLLEKRIRRLGPDELGYFIKLDLGSHLKREAVNRALKLLATSDGVLAYRSLEKLSVFDVDLATAALIRKKTSELPSAQLVDDIKKLPPGVGQNFALRQTLKLWTADRMDSYLASNQFINMNPRDQLWFLVESRGAIISKSPAGFFKATQSMDGNAAFSAIESGIRQIDFETNSFSQILQYIPPQYRQHSIDIIQERIKSNKKLVQKFNNFLQTGE
jgi:hypothetical protein